MKRAIALLTWIHRYLGLAFCVIFVIWFASGLVMIYARMPEYSASERATRLASLDPASIHLTPAEALEHALLAETPARIRISTLESRPVYRFLVQGEWVTVFGDDGSALEPLSPDAAVRVVKAAFPAERETTHFIRTLDEPDQWSIESSFQMTGPLHLVSLGDAAATNLYVAANTGEIALKTDRSSRFWGYAGPVMHWFYFRPLRVHGAFWYDLIVYGSVVGCVICVIGLIIGVYRYSLARRYYRGISATPYVGWLRWHHYAGLVFGVITFTWLFSGLLSMEPWGISENAAPSRSQVIAVRGRGVDATAFSVTPAQAFDALRQGASDGAMAPKELDLIQFMGAAYYRAQDDAGRTLLVTGDRGPEVQSGFDETTLRAAAAAALPDARASDVTWLTKYDGYYYGRNSQPPLPVLRVKYDDANATWLYFAARDGQVVLRETSRGRPVRWLYHGLHSLDFPGLYEAGWWWDAVIVSLCTGGLLLSLTSVVVGWGWLRRRRA